MIPSRSEPVRDFLASFSTKELEHFGVLNPNQRFGHLLQGTSVVPLLALLRREGVARLHHGLSWELHVDGQVRNAWARYPNLVDYRRCKADGDVFRDANQHINPYYGSPSTTGSTASKTTSAQPRRPPSATASIAEPIFTSEDISKPENRCNLAIFHLLAYEPFHRWFVDRLELPTTTLFYPRQNQHGTRPDLIACDTAHQPVGVIEIELGGADAAQMTNYRTRHERVFLITGMDAPGSDLNLEAISAYFVDALPRMTNPQQALSAKYLVLLIAESVHGGAHAKRAPVSDATLQHPFIANLLALLVDHHPIPGARGPTPGRLYWDTVGAEGFSLKAYSTEGDGRRIALLSRSGGREALIFQSAAKYRRYLGHRKQDAQRWCDFVAGTLKLPIDTLDFDQRRDLPIASVEPHLQALAALIKALA